jgi:hypothetical protein
MSEPSGIRWPADMRPERASVHTSNVLDMDVAPERVWAWLIRATRWPDWYRHCKNVVLENAAGPDLALGTRFSWTTLGIRVTTVVEELEAPFRLGWRGATAAGRGYHTWLVEPRGTGSRVVTDETQRGPLPWVARSVIRRVVFNAHDEWLAALARVAESGPPPD